MLHKILLLILWLPLNVFAYTCPSEGCEKCFAHTSDLYKHLQTEHHRSTFPCFICGMVFNDIANINDHILHIHEGKRFSCHLCGAKFKSSSSKQYHMKSVHEKVRFPCNICKKSFASRSYLKQHSCKGNKKKLEEHPNNSTAHLREHPTSSHIEENRVTEFTDHGSGIQDLSLNIEELYSPPSFEETAQNSETTQQPICFQGLKWDMTEMDLVQILEESEASEPACKKMRFPDPLEDF